MSDGSPAPQPPRILHITRNLPPLRGGMERLNLHVALELAARADLAVIGPAGCRAALPPAIAVEEVPARKLARFFAGALMRSVRMARRFRPQIVFAGSGLVAPFAWIAARLAGARMVVYVHGLDLIVAHPVYRWLFRPFIRRADSCIANSRHTAALAARIGVDEARIAVVHPGVDVPRSAPQSGDFRERFAIGPGPILLSVGRLIPRKGLREFVENSLPGLVRRFPAVRLVVLGDEAPDRLQGGTGGLAEAVRDSAQRLGLAEAVRLLGPQDDATLAAAYAAADVHVFPVREVADDVEGFGMVAVEAAAHGLPTVAFAVGGVPDAVEDHVSGRLVAPGDYSAFADSVAELLAAGASSGVRQSARAFAQRFEWERFGRRLCDVLGIAAATR